MKVTLTGYVIAEQNSWDTEPKLHIWPFNIAGPQSPERVFITQQDFEVEIPDDFDIRVGLVENLRKKKEKAMADFQAMVTEIDRQIAQHLAISNDVVEA